MLRSLQPFEGRKSARRVAAAEARGLGERAHEKLAVLSRARARLIFRRILTGSRQNVRPRPPALRSGTTAAAEASSEKAPAAAAEAEAEAEEQSLRSPA